MSFIDFEKEYMNTKKESQYIHRYCNMFAMLRLVFFCVMNFLYWIYSHGYHS